MLLLRPYRSYAPERPHHCKPILPPMAPDGAKLPHVPTPKYIGITLDRSLTFHQHIKAVAAKTLYRVNLLRRLAGTGWGASYNTLHTSVALAYSTAEYAAPVWSHSAHSHKVDVVLNDAMRLVSGCLMSTPVENLPVLSGIAPANLRRNLQTIKLAKKYDEPGSLVPPPTVFEEQIISRNHFATQALKLQSQHPINHPGSMSDGPSNGPPQLRTSSSLLTVPPVSPKVATLKEKPGLTSTGVGRNKGSIRFHDF